MRQLAERRAIDEQHRRQVAYAVCQLLLGDTAAAADTLGLSAGSPVKCERSMLAFVKVRRAASFCVYRTAATACGSAFSRHRKCLVRHLADAAVVFRCRPTALTLQTPFLACVCLHSAGWLTWPWAPSEAHRGPPFLWRAGLSWDLSGVSRWGEGQVTCGW